ncbi:Ig-like domain-containing protein [Thalassospira australica]|uniref:Ig-like domain-containing protein n=1 Tax=Thalassospira australica TaxID=1528106 RepID=UPI00051A1510|nr:Ig-like domain-containing protein [Thalassospira australica]
MDVTGEADAPTLDVTDASGTEDSPIALDIDAGLTDSGEVLSVTISNIPDGATLSAGTVNADGTVTLTTDELDGLTITPPADYTLRQTAPIPLLSPIRSRSLLKVKPTRRPSTLPMQQAPKTARLHSTSMLVLPIAVKFCP